MGTSSQGSGSGTGTPLVPSWLEDPNLSQPPGDSDVQPADNDAGDQAQDSQKGNGQETPVVQNKRFQSARANFSRFAGSGGRDRSALRRAVRDYVRSGTGGSRNAVLRMGSSRAAASRALSVLRSLQRDGTRQTLQGLNLEQLSGGSVQDVFIGLTSVVCRDGGSIDEAIARDAWLETIADLSRLGIGNLDALTNGQVEELFLSFIAHSIEARLYQEIGVNGFKLSSDLHNIDAFDAAFRDYIARSVRDSFSGDFSGLSAMSNDDIGRVVYTTYAEAWELLEQLGDREG